MSNREYNYSSIQAAYSCLHKYKTIYVDKMKPQVPDNADLHFGTAVHAGLNSNLKGEDGKAVFNLLWDMDKLKDMKYGRLNWDELKTAGNLYIERFDRLYKKRIQVIAAEQTLRGTLGPIRLYGTPDVVGLWDGVPSIIDFKTSRTDYPKEKIECNEQTWLYAHLAKQALGVDIKQLVYLVFVKTPYPKVQRPIVFELQTEKFNDMLTNISDVCHDLENRQVFYKNRNGCLMGTFKCDLYDNCYKRK